jgi:RNA 2',3'-cyclic 3'-phosphodiesterase
MRLFTAIQIPSGIGAGIGALLDRLRPLAKLSWTTPQNLHVTLTFIGEWPEERLEEVNRALDAVPRPGPIEIAVRGLGWFPNDHNPRVFWAGIEAGDLAMLARDSRQALSAIGVALEDREFHPHLTLARRRKPVPVDRLRDEVSGISSEDLGRFRAESFFLYLSKGGMYVKLREFPFVSKI